VDKKFEENGIEQTFGIEWFESSLTGEQLAELK
jgi:hypothetical protein